MIREQKAPLGPRPAEFTSSSTRQNENYEPSNGPRTRIVSGSKEPPTLTASSRNHHSLFSFGNIGGNAVEDSTASSESLDFLPSVNFDDLHSSITTASNDFEGQHSPVLAPNGFENMIRTPIEDASHRSGSDARGVVSTRPNATSRTGRSGSIIRRQSTSTRQSSLSSTTSSLSGANEPTSATTATTARTRRQPLYPPISGTGAMKGTRKSVGPGMLDTSDLAARGAPRSRPGMVNSISLQSNLGDSATTSRSSVNSTANAAETGARLASARAAKSRSMQPTMRQGASHLDAPVSTPEHSRSSSFGGRSPGKPNGRGTATPSSSARRMSVMPGLPPSSSHATGLGARTVSPTDARRMKRMSMVQGPPPMPQTPPTSQPVERSSAIRATSKSPSMLPRKTSTPSSSRTTPDPNRKSYSSGLSVTSNASFNTARTSTGSLQPRLPQSASLSRLPTPKPNTRNVHSSLGDEDEEEVPPVPAIPKAYESPKESPIEAPFFTKQRKSSLPSDSLSINSTSTSEWVMPTSRESSKQDESRTRRNPVIDHGQNGQTPTKRKNLQPLRLPPLNLLPLSTPTAAKVAALKPEPATAPGTVTPPPRRPTKTPSTPMTASKTSFFSSRKQEDDNVNHATDNMRSATSVNHIRAGSSTIRHVSGSGANTMPIPTMMHPPRQANSPFISTSLPKSESSDYTFLTRSNTTAEYSAESGGEQKQARLTGPRAQRITKENLNTPTQSSPDEPSTPSSSTSSLRRKLSMGWKRTTSKSSINISHAANERESEYPPQPPKHNDMPPPKLPASATMSSLHTLDHVPSPSPSVRSTTHAETKTRKSSISSLNVFSNHGRTTSDSLSVNGSPKRDFLGVDGRKIGPRASSSVLSTAHKMLNGKASSNSLKPDDPWTVDLDKDDLHAEDEMKKLASKRRETESAARQLDALRKRAVPKERVSPQQALQLASLNIYERGEIVDYKDVYFCGTTSAQKLVGDLSTDTANFGYDDDRGDYSIVLGDHLCYRYEIVDLLGKGSFGQVVRCIDHKTGVLVAIKIIRNKKRFHQQALVEVNILKKLREWDPQNKHSMVNFTQSFYFRGHLCISTELLDMNLYEFIKSNSFRGFSLKLIRRFTKQLLSSLLLLKQHKVIHCDLKPENILLAHPMHSEIKVIDFGSSCFENEKVYTYIQSRFYRSPEVILGMTYGMPIDMWSVGCILAELYTGYPIFPGENEQEQLACIMEVFGPPEKHLIEKCTRKKLFFDSLGKPRLTVSSKGRRRKPSSKTLQQVLKCDDEPFLDFLTKCLKWDPDRRLKPEEAVRHEFLTGMKATAQRIVATVTMPRSTSPLKRYNTITTPSTSSNSRPLPEPPTTSFKNGIAVRTTTGASPVKSSGGAALQRRQSAATNFNSSTGSSSSGLSGIGKRVSLGGANLTSSTVGAGGSALPTRVAQRNASGSMAGAGATAAMRRQ